MLLIRVDPSHWTADFRIARALAEAYSASEKNDVLFVCVGDPRDDIGYLGAMVADETSKYFPHVLGGSQHPVVQDNFAASVLTALERWPEAFVIVIEAGRGRAAHLGSIEITDRAPTSVFDPQVPRYFGDLTVNAVLRIEEEASLSGGPPASSPVSGIRSQALAEAREEVGSDDDAERTGLDRKKFKPLQPGQITRTTVRKIADVVIDGNLRFLSKIGKQRL